MSNEFFTSIMIISIVLANGFIFYILIRNSKKKESKNKTTPEKIIESPANPILVEKFKLIYPLKLQAYERLVLFLERIEPSNLVMRNNTGNTKYNELHSTLLNTILEEFEHNVAQQIYVSENAWNLTKQAKEETINILNISANELKNNASSADLSRKIFEKMMLVQKSPSQIALDYIRQELKEII